MSKSIRFLLPVFVALLLILHTSEAQDIEATLTIDIERSIVQVDGRHLNAAAGSSQPLVFLSDYGGIRLSNDRIRNVKRSGSAWSYEVDLTPEQSPAAMAHSSWITKDGGVLMLGDLLPHPQKSDRPIKVRIVPLLSDKIGDVRATSSEKMLDAGQHVVTKVEKAVIYITPGSTGRPQQVLFFGTFQFSRAEAISLADEIDREYRERFRSEPLPYLIGLANLRVGSVNGTWEADTRGANITIVSTDMPFKSQSLQRLHEQLRHEMFHLWIPEGVNLSGNYDWFYEGFALYQSLKLGVAVNRLRFEDYLDSLSQAYAIDRRLGGKASLIDASKNRWSGDNNSVIYARGMLVAFVSDLATLEASKGKRSTDDIVREVYQKHSGKVAKQDGNAAVMAIMKQRPELRPIVERYVTGSEKLDWAPFLAAAGLEATGPNRTALTTVAKPNGRQKKLLDKLGYNNWRKLSSTRK